MRMSASSASTTAGKSAVRTIVETDYYESLNATKQQFAIAITFGIIAALIEPVAKFFGQVSFGEFFATEGDYGQADGAAVRGGGVARSQRRNRHP